MKITFLPYNRNLKKLSRKLRNDSTLSEILLWNEIKSGKILGYKFNRQKPIGNYIVDFYCQKLNLVIEIDGESHDYEESVKADSKRQKELENFGLTFLRFEDIEVKQEIDNVLGTIELWIEQNATKK